MPRQWLQLKGDPSIRRFLFSQTRIESLFDTRCREVIDRVEDLVLNHGIFHIKIHFSSNQLTLWLMENPYDYRVLAGEEMFDPTIPQRVQKSAYPDNAEIRTNDIRPLLERFCELRFNDDTVYLRSGSINIMNGSVGLNFSCDGSHYVDHREFLRSPLSQL